MNVLTVQTELTDWQIAFIGPNTFPKFWEGKKAKATTKVTPRATNKYQIKVESTYLNMNISICSLGRYQFS